MWIRSRPLRDLILVTFVSLLLFLLSLRRRPPRDSALSAVDTSPGMPGAYADGRSIADESPGTDALSDHDFCGRLGWRPFRMDSSQSAGERRKVYDLVMVNTELDWLEIRLNTTFEQVDYYVIVEGRKTFQGNDKPLALHDVLFPSPDREDSSDAARFAPYRAKIIYHELAYPAGFSPLLAWDYEDLQRNSMFSQVFPGLQGARAPNLGDVLVVGDVDEIVRPAVLATLRRCIFPRRMTLRSRFYYYSFQFRHRGPDWPHPQATFYAGPRRTLLPNDLRVGNGDSVLRRVLYHLLPPTLGSGWLLDRGDMPNASWHCSSCLAAVADVLGKMASFSHVKYNEPRFRDPDRIADRFRNGKDLWDREGEMYDRIENNTDVPGFLLQNRQRFSYILSRDGPSAGFSDYYPEIQP